MKTLNEQGAAQAVRLSHSGVAYLNAVVQSGGHGIPERVLQEAIRLASAQEIDA